MKRALLALILTVALATPAQAASPRRLSVACLDGAYVATVKYKMKRGRITELSAKNPCTSNSEWLVVWWKTRGTSDSSADSVSVAPGHSFKWRKVKLGGNQIGANLKTDRPTPGGDGTHRFVD